MVVHLALDMSLDSEPRSRGRAGGQRARHPDRADRRAAAARVPRVVLCTSAMVYGALPDNDVPLAEDAPLRATADASLVGDLLEIEGVGRAHPACAPACQGHRGPARRRWSAVRRRTAVTRHFEAAAPARGLRRAAPLAVLPPGRPGPPRWSSPRSVGGRGCGHGGLGGLAGAGGDRGVVRHARDGVARLGLALGTAEGGCTTWASPPPRRVTFAYTMHGWVVSAERLRASGGLAAGLDQRGGVRGAPGGHRRPAHRRRPQARPQGRHRRGSRRRHRRPARRGRAWCAGPASGGESRSPPRSPARPAGGRRGVLARHSPEPPDGAVGPSYPGAHGTPVERAIPGCRCRTARWEHGAHVPRPPR